MPGACFRELYTTLAWLAGSERCGVGGSQACDDLAQISRRRRGRQREGTDGPPAVSLEQAPGPRSIQ